MGRAREGRPYLRAPIQSKSNTPQGSVAEGLRNPEDNRLEGMSRLTVSFDYAAAGMLLPPPHQPRGLLWTGPLLSFDTAAKISLSIIQG